MLKIKIKPQSPGSEAYDICLISQQSDRETRSLKLGTAQTRADARLFANYEAACWEAVVEILDE